MTYDEKVDGLDAIIEDLVEWELGSMNMDALESYFLHSMKEFYKDNPEDLEDMLVYREETFRELARQQDNE
mgnify:CR=1 FL=1|tara:strand:- start:272 stop:484 length:213 start_codon:yes stop_codon:yes gene_type:complete